jgi:hypothetical protein
MLVKLRIKYLEILSNILKLNILTLNLIMIIKQAIQPKMINKLIQVHLIFQSPADFKSLTKIFLKEFLKWFYIINFKLSQTN